MAETNSEPRRHMQPPQDYKDVLTRLTEGLLEQCHALNGGETEGGFEGDLIRFRENFRSQVYDISQLTAALDPSENPGLKHEDLGPPYFTR